VFDGTGVALQDLAVAQLSLDLAVERDLVVDYDY
jgi:ornithine cyclodeaminase/alanine dehydrogenase-like protein (mu-crystallin family)